MKYTVTNQRGGFEIKQEFTNYDQALDFYKHECAEIGGPVILIRWTDDGLLDVILHNTRG